MKQLLYLLLILSSCKAKEDSDSLELTFNGFKVGAPSDSIQYALGFPPDRITRSKLEYNDVTFEGIKSIVNYRIAGGRMVSANFLEKPQAEGSYSTLKTSLIKKFGKPIQENNDTMVWEGENAALYATKAEGGVYVDFTRKDKPGLYFKTLPK